MKFIVKILLVLFIIFQYSILFAQSNLEKQGMQAWMSGDFKSAVMYLEKAEVNNPSNVKTLKMLGYSYFQCADFDKAINTYTKLLHLKPDDYSAYYYRGKAQLNIANNPKTINNTLRNKYYLSSIEDFTKALEVSGEEDVQILQNRGIASKDYGIFKSYSIKRKADKKSCILLFNNSINDFQKILSIQPLKKDIVAMIEFVNAQINSLN